MDAHTHKVYISENGVSNSVDRGAAIVSDEGVDGVEVRSVVPQVVLMSVRRPQDAEVLSVIANPEHRVPTN